jgi:hypothetical protein
MIAPNVIIKVVSDGSLHSHSRSSSSLQRLRFGVLLWLLLIVRCLMLASYMFFLIESLPRCFGTSLCDLGRSMAMLNRSSQIQRSVA